MKKTKKRARAARGRPTPPQPSVPFPPQSHPDEDSTAEDQRRAVGALLAFYRRVRRKDRTDLIHAAGISNSLLSRIEGGERLPTREVLVSFCKELQLAPFEGFQLRAMAGYESKNSEAPESGPLASDALRGIPLFLRTPEDERRLTVMPHVPEVWIVSRRPLILVSEYFEMMRSILLDEDTGRTKYVWFLDKQTGAEDAEHVRERLNSDEVLKEQGVDWSKWIEFVLCPSTLSIASPRLGIYNPREKGTLRRYGRAIYMSEGRPVGLYQLDDSFVTNLASFLMRMYDGCKSIAGHPDPWYPQDPEIAKTSGTFRFWKPVGPSGGGQSSTTLESH